MSAASDISLIHEKSGRATTLCRELYEMETQENYDRELSKCNFLHQYSTYFRQKHMSALNRNINAQTVLLVD